MNPAGYVLGMDIGGTNLRMGLVDNTFRVRHLEVLPTRLIYETGNTVEALARTIGTFLEKHPDTRPLRVAAGFPSVVDRARRRLYSSTNLPGLDGVDVVGALEEALGLPVEIDHDAYYLLAHDIWAAGMKNEGTIAGCYFGTGMGNALYIGGAPYVGKNGTACELGHLQVPLSDMPCTCGNRGCIEMFCCGKAFERLAAQQFPDVPLGEVFVRHGGNPALRDFVRYMAVPVSAEANILDPDCIFLGGGLVQMKGFPREEFVKAILAGTRKPYPAANLRLEFADASPENGIIGAALRAFAHLEG